MRALILGALLALALPSSALAATQYYIPPGNSSGNQYVESIPSAGGNTPTGGIGHHGAGGAGSGGALSQGTQSALVAQGPDGSHAAAFANATAPQGAGSGSTPSSTGAGEPGTAGGGGSAGSGNPGSTHGASGGAGGPGTAGGGSNGAAGAQGTNAGGSSPASSVVRSLTGFNDHGGFGLLPIALIAVAVGLGAIALGRRHALGRRQAS